jgi:hypothetical protein
MSAVAAPARVYVKQRGRAHVSAAAVGRIMLFGCSFAAYFALGYRVVVHQHLAVSDAVSRLAHAYFVWYNHPQKLTAVGFVWPPGMTLVFLPFAAVKTLATSLAALPLTSAVFGAALLVVLEKILCDHGMAPFPRYVLVVLFGVNPMIVFYATNGMSEVVYLFLLTAGVGGVLRWLRRRDSRDLVVAGTFFALGLLTRYEVALWAGLAAVALVILLIRRRVPRLELEASLITLLTPVLYAGGLWLFFNWLILGDPLAFVHGEAGTFGRYRTVGDAPTHAGLGELAWRTASLTWQLAPLVFVVAAALVAAAIVRRNGASLAVAAIVLLNLGFTITVAYLTESPNLLQLRYNMRPMPLALAAVGWLYWLVQGRTARRLVAGGAVALLALSLPLTWHVMRTWPEQFEEAPFTRALASGQDQEGTEWGGYRIGIAPERDMAAYIGAHITRPNWILVDDSQSYDVMLLNGHPERFYDRIDRGDARWRDVLDSPRGRVGYFLVPRERPIDLIRVRYPKALSGGVPWLRPVHVNARWELFRVLPPATS